MIAMIPLYAAFITMGRVDVGKVGSDLLRADATSRLIANCPGHALCGTFPSIMELA